MLLDEHWNCRRKSQLYDARDSVPVNSGESRCYLILFTASSIAKIYNRFRTTSMPWPRRYMQNDRRCRGELEILIGIDSCEDPWRSLSPLWLYMLTSAQLSPRRSSVVLSRPIFSFSYLSVRLPFNLISQQLTARFDSSFSRHWAHWN